MILMLRSLRHRVLNSKPILEILMGIYGFIADEDAQGVLQTNILTWFTEVQ